MRYDVADDDDDSPSVRQRRYEQLLEREAAAAALVKKAKPIQKIANFNRYVLKICGIIHILFIDSI